MTCKINYEEIEELASLQFSSSEVAIIISVKEEVFENDSKAVRAFMRGRLKAQAQVRQMILEMARQGSTPAQKEFQKLAEASEPNIEDSN